MISYSVIALCAGLFVVLLIAVIFAVLLGAWGEEIESERWSGQ
jgi:hypothetical protein